MRYLRLAATALALLALVGSAAAGAATRSNAPRNLRAFLLRPNEPIQHTFSRTPSFAWSPVRGARCYELQLATSPSFADNTIVWPGAKGSCVAVPGASVDAALPWFTGSPYAIYARVRAIRAGGPTAWSASFGFNMRWADVPKPLPSQPGLIRWTPVPGATAYQVWYVDTGNPAFLTTTNVADEREFYSFHRDTPGLWTTIRWRVRAVRQVQSDPGDTTVLKALAPVSYGPWSRVYTTTNPPLSNGPVTPRLAVSDRTTRGQGGPLRLMPALTFPGSTVGGRRYDLYRVYIATDRDCVNIVYRGSVTGAPAWAPRPSAPLKLPASDADLSIALAGFLQTSADGQPATFSYDGAQVTSSELGAAPATAAATSSSGTQSASSAPAAAATAVTQVDLPDLAFPTTRYFWTVVPVVIVADASGGFRYVDAELPQDACSAPGRVGSFVKQSQPVVTSAGTPFVSGLAPNGRLLGSVGRSPVLYGTPLVSWQPAMGASQYEVQWSRTPARWPAGNRKVTSATSALLSKLSGTSGTWYYRVRGLNPAQLGTPSMSWSTPVKIRLARPVFRLVSSSR